MSIKKNLVKAASSTTGTGTLTLSSVVGWAPFSVYSVGDVVPYAIYNGDNKEVGLGTVGAGSTLARTTVLATLVSGSYDDTSPAAITLAGTSTVHSGPLAEMFSDGGAQSGLFASLPSASGNAGMCVRVTDVGPAPGIELISDGTIWRPRGGRQVLAMRSINPVTVQNLSGAVAETIGPFPDGLVRAGMQLAANVFFHHPGVGTASRTYRLCGAWIHGHNISRA